MEANKSQGRIMTNDGVGPICPNGGISSGQMTALSPANTFVNRLRPSHTVGAQTGTIKKRISRKLSSVQGY